MIVFYKHIAGSGAKKGQWVNCTTSPSACPLGGTIHADSRLIEKVRDWSGRRAYSDVNLQDYKDYMQSEIAGTLEADRKPLETLEEKKARLGVDTFAKKAGKKQPGTRMKETLALKDSLSEKEFYNKLYEDYPELQNKSLQEQREINNMLDIAMKGKNTPSMTVRAGLLKSWVKNGQTDKLESLKDTVNFLYVRRGPAKPKGWPAIVSALESEIDTKRESKVRESLNDSTKATRVAPVNNIQDYKPLNDDSVASQIALKHLTEYEVPGTGAFGSKNKVDKYVEYMVRNQVVLNGNLMDHSFKRVPAVEYLSNIDSRVQTLYKAAEIFSKTKNTEYKKSATKLAREAENYIESDNNRRAIRQASHDEFVSTSKTQLLRKAVNKGHEDSGLLLRIQNITKASEVYELEKTVDSLKYQDEFSKAGL